MTGSPADILAAARTNPVGPYLPAKDGWLKGWTGPVLLVTDIVPYVVAFSFVRGDGVTVYVCASCTNPSVVLYAVAENIRLDTRRPEVRHLLCDLGVAPEWARRSAVACWCAGMGVSLRLGISTIYHSSGDNARAMAIASFLSRGGVHEEPDGYHVPLADGGIGWWANDSASK